MKLLLTRHGHVPGIAPERFRGRMELELTERGLREASRTAEWIVRHHQPTIVYSSPMKRCTETARRIAERCGSRTEVLPALLDIDYGAWQGRTHVEVAESFPQQYARWKSAPQWMQFPEGESFQDLMARAAKALRIAAERHADQTIVMVGHDSVNRAMLMQLLDQPLSAYWRLALDPCSVSEIWIEQASVVVKNMNQTAHLEEG